LRFLVRTQTISRVHKYTNSAKKGAGEWSKSSPLDILAALTGEATGAINSKVSNKDVQKTMFDFLKVVSDEAETYLTNKGVGHQKMGQLGHKAVVKTQKTAQTLAKKHKVEKNIKKGVQQLKKGIQKFGSM